jgi:hypothetical protein
VKKQQSSLVPTGPTWHSIPSSFIRFKNHCIDPKASIARSLACATPPNSRATIASDSPRGPPALPPAPKLPVSTVLSIYKLSYHPTDFFASLCAVSSPLIPPEHLHQFVRLMPPLLRRSQCAALPFCFDRSIGPDARISSVLIDLPKTRVSPFYIRASHFAPSSPLTSFFPLHTPILPLTPLFPLDRKVGGGWGLPFVSPITSSTQLECGSKTRTRNTSQRSGCTKKRHSIANTVRCFHYLSAVQQLTLFLQKYRRGRGDTFPKRYTNQAPRLCQPHAVNPTGASR